MATTSHHGAHECRAPGSAGVCSELCARCWVAHRIERNPDWKVFLNMAAAAGALTHVRSAPQALARTGGSVSRSARARACVTPCANLTPKRFLQRVG